MLQRLTGQLVDESEEVGVELRAAVEAKEQAQRECTHLRQQLAQSDADLEVCLSQCSYVSSNSYDGAGVYVQT